MPDYRGIAISLHSQFDCRQIPEYPPPSTDTAPSPRKSDPTSTLASFKPSQTSASADSHVAECYVPLYPASQFWIDYAILSSAPLSKKTTCLYFKLFVEDKCILSWGVDEEDNWSGKVMWGIYSGEKYFERRVLERQAFIFPNLIADEGFYGGFEIRVFRSKGRKRVRLTLDDLPEISGDESMFTFMPAGRVSNTDPRRMYSYALIDPVDSPYATFQYHCRTQQQLNDMDIAAPISRCIRKNEKSELDDISRSLAVLSTKARTKTSTGATPPASKRKPSTSEDASPKSENDDPGVVRRLSVPPRTRLISASSYSQPHPPVKKKSRRPSETSEAAADDKPRTLTKQRLDADGVSRRDFMLHEAPPPRVGRTRLQRAVTPPAATMRRAGSVGLLNSIVSNAMKRKAGGNRDGSKRA